MTFPDASSYWQDIALPEVGSLDRDLKVDVIVVGGGLTGITTAYLLQNEGVRVALLERARFADADTGHTTSHLTYVTDYRLHELVKHFGKSAAREIWQAGAAAIDQIQEIVGQTSIDCEFQRVPGYLHMPAQANSQTDQQKELQLFNEDLILAEEFGFDVSFLDDIGLAQQSGLRFANQAKFHPRKYLRSLLRVLIAADVPVFELTEFQEAQESPLAVRANGHEIRCDYVVMATHNPLMGLQGTLKATSLQTKLSLYTSYVLGGTVAKDALPEALYWDTRDPYDYLRVDSHADHQYVIFGGGDIKTGQEKQVASSFDQLAQRLERLVPQVELTHRWLGQVIETDDGLPFIGENEPRQFIATGFSGNGFTFGTVSAMMARDRILGRPNEWSDLFRVNRKPFHGGVWRYVRENLDYPAHFIGDRLHRHTDTLTEVQPGEGKIISLNGEHVAAHRDQAGELSLCSAVCTHMKCLVRWNDVASTWDCPCHGSRFNADGTVLSGPAESPLDHIDVPAGAHSQSAALADASKPAGQ